MKRLFRKPRSNCHMIAASQAQSTIPLHQVLTIFMLFSGGLLLGCQQVPKADVVFTNGGIYTVDSQNSWVEAAAISDGVIVATGSNKDIASYIGAQTRVVDLTGKMALPGFTDAHVHVINGASDLHSCVLNDAKSLQEVLNRLHACADETTGQWVISRDLNLALFPDGIPDKAVLDAEFPDRPLFLGESSAHFSWVNSKALELANVTRATADPENGKIQRNPDTGEATGFLAETAQDLIENLLPELSLEERTAWLHDALKMTHALGITGWIEANTSEKDWQAYQSLDQEGALTARVTASIAYGLYSRHPGDEFEQVLARRHNYDTAHFRLTTVKIYVDGVLEADTAALLEPYDNPPGFNSKLAIEPSALNAAVTRFDAMGLQVQMHAIGDAAVRAGLDSYAAAQQQNGKRDNRHHMAHLQLIDPSDIPRFAALDVTANFQALWAFPDSYITEINLPQVGQERVNRMYPIGSVARSGGRMVGGSDWSVSSINPLDAIETAVRRQDAREEDGPILNAAERVDLATMIAAYTRNAAWLMHEDDKGGSIENGKRADIIVLDRNLFSIPTTEINEAQVLLTLFDGKIVFEAK